jgi:hypothetical protein
MVRTTIRVARGMKAVVQQGWTAKVAGGRGGAPRASSLLLALLAGTCGPSSTLDRDPVVIDAAARGGAGGRGGANDASGGAGGSPEQGGAAGEAPGDGPDAVAIDDGGVTDDGGTEDASIQDTAGEPLAPDVAVDVLPPRPDVAPGPPELARGRVGHWKLDEGRGNVGIDSSGIGNHGGTVNILGPDWGMGRLGTALIFTPARRTFLIIASHPTLGPTEAMSISVWVHPASWTGTPRVLQKGDDDIQYGLRAEGEQFRFVLRLDSGVAMVSGPLPPVDRWTHIGATYDGRELRLYMDGSAVAMQTAVGAIATPFTALTVGARSQNAPQSDFFAGLIDDVIIYQRALSAAEVRLLSEGKSP